MLNLRFVITITLCAIAAFTLISTPVAENNFGWYSVLPPLFAIALALCTREVLLALLGGIWLGASHLAGGNPLSGLARTLDQHLILALNDPDHISILLFSLTLGGMVGIIGASGGAAGIVQKVSRWAKTPRSGQLAAWAMGIIVFFDDYANTLIVGNTFRPLTDRLRISREKLSFIVDATAAPIASIALISTWIGFEVGLIADGLAASGAISNPQEAYGIFIQTIPYRFYPLITLLLVFLVGFWGRDFGPMLRAEQRCRKTGAVESETARPLMDTDNTDQIRVAVTARSWLWGLIPITTVIIATVVGLYVDGRNSLLNTIPNAPLYQIISSANSFAVLMWASFLGALTAGLSAVLGAELKLTETVEAFTRGVKAMTTAAIVLLMAWALGEICQQMNTAGYITDISREILKPQLIPALTFLISGAIAFATGTSWGTLAILMPIVAPISHTLPIEAGLSPGLSYSIMISSIAAVLAGSVFGDHASPISDTTIMSSMASGADHIDHVRTQIPYAALAAAAALLFGYLPAGMGVPPAIGLTAGAVAVAVTIRLLGRKV